MARTLQFKRYANTALATITGANGEIIIDSTNQILTLHDGITPGGRAAVAGVANDVTARATANLAYFKANAANNLATSGYAQANAANNLAQSAFDYANTIVSDTQVDPVARTIANTASNTIIVIQGVNDYQNTNIFAVNAYATSGYSQSNAANSLASVGYGQANAANSLAQSSYNTANTNATAITLIQGVNTYQNTSISSVDAYAYSGYGKANTSNNLAQAAFTQANAATIGINAGYNQANSAYTQANAANTLASSGYAQANSANNLSDSGYTKANAAYGQANSANTLAVSSYVQANAANTLASSGYAQANAAATSIPQNTQTTNYVLQPSDGGKHIYYTQSANVNLYIPNTGQATFLNGQTIMIVSQTTSSANITILPNTGVSLYLAGNTTVSASRNVTTYGMATLIRVAANTWFINGTGVS